MTATATRLLSIGVLTAALAAACGGSSPRSRDAGHDAQADDAATPRDGGSDGGGDARVDPVDGACPEGLAVCDVDGRPACVDLYRDSCNCGGCGIICDCHGGVCQDCGGLNQPCPIDVCVPNPRRECVDTDTDESNCGYCFHECAPGQNCNAGECVDPL